LVKSTGRSNNLKKVSINYHVYVFECFSLVSYSINVQISQGSLVALVGMVGSGKTSILSALLGEMNKIEGRVCVSGKIAYVPQTAWIMNTTLKENILFGQDFNKQFYDRVIDACALKQDFGRIE